MITEALSMHAEPVTQNISIERISPSLLRATIFNRERKPPKTRLLPRRAVYDYELEYFIYSEGAMWLDDTLYPLHEGDLVFRRPGQITQGVRPYSCYLICFDLTGDSGKNWRDYNFKTESQFQTDFRNSFLDVVPPLFHPQSGQIYETLLDSIVTEFINYNENSSIIIKAHLLRLLYQIHQELTDNQMNIPLSPHYARLKRSVDFMHEKFAARISLQDIANIAELSPTYFHRIFTETFKVTPNEYLNQIRLNKAKELLAKTSNTVNEISVQCGFENTAYFSYLFKQRQQCSPSKYRAKYSYV
jgi:AraC family transcriptional regulator